MAGDNDDIHMIKERAIRARAKEALRKWREAKGFTQEEMASFLNVTHKSYSKYEGDQTRGVPMTVIAQFCLIADIDPAWMFLGRKGKKAAPTSVSIAKNNDAKR